LREYERNHFEIQIKNVNEHRFKYLIDQYKQDSLSQAEYQELIGMLKDNRVEHQLESILDRYWEEPEFILQVKPEQAGKDVRRGKFSREQTLQNTSTPSRLNISTPQRFYWGIAATIVLLIGLFFYLGGTTNISGSREIVYTTGFGERLEVELNDDSHITLNANSELRWSEEWKEKGNRQAILKGEAFFEVKKQNGIPFIVNTNDVAVEVLGTSFNVDSREEKTVVYLDEGKVNLRLKDQQDQEDLKKDQEIVMKPGDQVKYSAKEKKIEKLEGQDLITAASWKKNVLNFKNKPFSEVLEILREIYGQSFECADRDLLTRPMVIGVPYADWEAVKQALELSLNVEFQKVDGRRYKVKSLRK